MFKLIEILAEKNSNELFDLYSVASEEINTEIKKKLLCFQSSHKFFEHYTKKNINQLLSSLSEFSSNIYELFDINQNISDTKTDKYISTLSKIYLALNLIHKINEISANILDLTKNCYSKLIFENKNQIINSKSINDYINELIDIYSNKNYILPTPKFLNNSPHISGKTSPFNNNFNEENINFSTYFETKKKSQIFSNSKEFGLASTLNENPEIETENKNQITNPEEVKFKYGENFSRLSLKEMQFVIEEQNCVDEENDIRKSNSTLNARVGMLYDSKAKKNRRKTTIENINPNKEMCVRLLEVIIGLYKNCLINSEEKLKLKQLIISKSKKIEQIYVDYFILCKYGKDKFIKELKKL